MSLFDMIDQVSEQNAVKTATGDNRLFGVTVGLVTQNYHKDMPGRLCVSIPTRDKEADELRWARLSMPYSGKSWGYYFMPEEGDQVLLAFEGGSIEKPYVIGSVPRDSHKFLTGSVTEKNETKRIVTKHGSSIVFTDNKEGDGEKDQILIQTAGKAHTFLLDNENKRILLQDEKGENKVEMKTESGQMTVEVKSKLTIKVGDGIKIILNGETGAVKIDAGEVSVKASKQLKLETDGGLSLKGAQVLQDGSSMVKVQSSGILKLSGTPVSLG